MLSAKTIAATGDLRFAPAESNSWSVAGSSVDRWSMIAMASHSAPVAVALTMTQVRKFLR